MKVEQFKNGKILIDDNVWITLDAYIQFRRDEEIRLTYRSENKNYRGE